ncbi:glycosyltransferase family 4 protein [Arenibacter sp. GZD96]|uniref:glycosyltransferase family 4 protein n=1 Tax=Aurantibrevibacter litoralis TaxID=3106030 RepID=UPI002AFF5AC6|nr:glycosyltransferase family 4 protein [Arenibacter sp. GZD-96]MEA1787467.1 glycosyltransferase family 4 protein [Arenibacter sp. GZD-96]
MRKVLIITYYWPPAGGPGVQRWLKFVTYLRDFNIDPVVYIPENPDYPLVDLSLCNEVPEGITIYKQPIWEPNKIAGFFFKQKTKRISSGVIHTKNQSVLERILLWIRGNLFIPDARKFWVKPSVKVLSKIIETEGIDTIITTGPPHSLHLIGYQLRKKHQLQWLADFRDPWTSIGYHKKLKLTKASKKKHKCLERLVLQQADKVIVTSTGTQREFAQIRKNSIKVITNGFDRAFSGIRSLDTFFSIVHIGSLLTGRNPTKLWAVLQELLMENADFKNSFKLRLVGVVSYDVLDAIYSYGLEQNLELVGYLSHAEAVACQKSAQILLLIEIDSEETKCIIPGKLFEYMAAQRPILAIGPKGWDAGTIINDTHTGFVFEYKEKEHLKSQILTWFSLYQKKQLRVNSKGIEAYSRSALTGKLAEYIAWE